MSNAQENKPQIVEQLEDLALQATTERSHYYVRSVAEKAQLAIGILMSENTKLQTENEKLKQANKKLREGYAKLIKTVPYNSVEPDYLVEARQTLSEAEKIAGE